MREGLTSNYQLSITDRIPIDGFDSVTADLANFDAILSAMKDKTTVVHLAAEPRHTPDIGWDILLPDNITATANVFEASRQSGVKQVIFFSSMHVNGYYEKDEPWRSIADGDYGDLDLTDTPLVTHEMPMRPDGPYAVSKIFGESLGAYYAEEYEMTVICIRLGTISNFDQPDDSPRDYVSWLSRRDLTSLVKCCIDANDIGYDIFFGASNNTWKIYDTPRACRIIGFKPQGNSETFRPKR